MTERDCGSVRCESADAEWVFLDTYFPDLTEKDVEATVTDFGERTRRFGS